MRRTLRYQRERSTALLDRPASRHPEIIEEDPAPVQHSLIGSCRFAFDGICHVALTQRHFRLQIICCSLVVAAGLYYRLESVEWAMLLTMLALVLTMELINTALESAIDLVTRDYHPLAKVAKDIAAAAVMLAALMSLIVGAVIFVPHILAHTH